MSSTSRCSLLVVDDEPYILTTLSALLAHDFEILTAASAEAAQAIFARRSVDLILTDQKMPRTSGVQLLEWVREHSPRTVRLLMTGFAELEDAVEAINRGKVYRYLFKPWRTDELLHILRDACHNYQLERQAEQQNEQIRSLNEELQNLNQALEQRVHDRTQELEQANQELHKKNLMLERLALTDPLTSLPNRRAIDNLAESEIRRRTRYPGSLALAFVDADHFKEINCKHLLPGGDQVLIDLGKVLCASVRTVDSVGRVGGEEFMVVAPETSLDGAHVLGERMRTAVEQYQFSYKQDTIHVTVSVGVAVADAGISADYDQLKHIAAGALAEAKSNGRNRCVVRSCSPALL